MARTPLRIHVPLGWYRVRASARGLRTVRENGLDGDDEYRIDLWPPAPTGVAVVEPHRWVKGGSARIHRSSGALTRGWLVDLAVGGGRG